MKARRLIVLLVIAALLSLGTASTPLAAGSDLATIPQATTIPMLVGTTEPIKLAYENQTSPQVACNLATYTNDDFQGNSIIKYFDFATNTEHIVPGNGLDRLSDTDGKRIAFTQVEPDGDHIVLYDIASQTTTPVPGARDFQPAIGGDLIAFVHGSPFSTSGNEIRVYDQNT